ncbi:MAG: hypothetical protein M1816_003964 [Peltula sp. TS41687]|nr:MAG: hypothetical protein M1816_003964 [Peltula sp. TS41687]
MGSTAEDVQLADPTLLDKIDKLRELNVSEYIPLPQITFRRDQRESITVSIIPSPASNSERAERLRAFRKENLKSLEGQSFVSILKEACDTMGIPSSGDVLTAGQSTFTEDVLKIELCGPQRQHLSVIDIPGIFRAPTPGVTTKADMELVRRIVYSYIENERTIILAVIPAPTDIATQEILTIADGVDRHGERTLGVLTKPDLVDKGGEEGVMDLVRGKRNPLRLGYCIVRNRGQQDVLMNSSDRHQKEIGFFATHPWATLDKDRVGIQALKDRLRELLVDITRREFPKVRQEIDKRLVASQRELSLLGPSRESQEQQHRYLLDLTTRFQKITDAALDAHYGRHDEFSKRRFLKLATIVCWLNEKFSDKVTTTGHTVEFNEPDEEQNLLFGASGVELQLDVDEHEDKDDDPEPSHKKGAQAKEILPSLNDYPELSEDVEPERVCVSPRKEGVLEWIEKVYRSSRGFELGTFSPAVVPTLWKEQCKNWEALALNYIDSVILVVHRFIRGLLTVICVDVRVRSNIFILIEEALLEGYKDAINHVRFILSVERSGTLVTTNHYFSDNLEKARLERVRLAMEKHSWETDDEHGKPLGKAVMLDSALQSVPMGNAQYTAQDIHDILKAYYKVARKRFVDTVCIQGADYHLVTGPKSPLRVFSPGLISKLNSDKLDFIAGEEMVSRRRRQALNQEIEALKKGKRLLAI